LTERALTTVGHFAKKLKNILFKKTEHLEKNILASSIKLFSPYLHGDWSALTILSYENIRLGRNCQNTLAYRAKVSATKVKRFVVEAPWDVYLTLKAPVLLQR
jgi:hypothetical protein